MTFSIHSATTAAVIILVVATCTAALQDRRIPATTPNVEYFDFVEQVLEKGTADHNCPSNQDEVLRCTVVCAATGSREREGCCCTAPSDSISSFVGSVDGCRYKQTLLYYNEVPPFVAFESKPLNATNGEMPFFGPSCQPSSTRTEPLDCTCDLRWELPQSELEGNMSLPSPIPPSPPPTKTPSVSPLPVSSSPSPIASPSVSVSPSASPSRRARRSRGPRRSPSASPSTSPERSGDGASSSPSSSVTETTPSPSDSVLPSPSDDEGESPSDGDGDTTESEGPDSSPDGDGGRVCVDERYLMERGFGPEDMVHRLGVWSEVWCPSIYGLPCGTSNHKVRLQGVSVSYKALCQRSSVQCTRETMKVNSVWSHQWREVTHGEAQLTMYDVRYSESAQRLLHRVMRGVRTMTS